MSISELITDNSKPSKFNFQLCERHGALVVGHPNGGGGGVDGGGGGGDGGVGGGGVDGGVDGCHSTAGGGGGGGCHPKCKLLYQRQ